MAQGYYASMGFGVPAALGAQIGTGQRPLILCGDGAFQMTGTEISHAPRHGLNPICVLVNNARLGDLPAGRRSARTCSTIPPWPYAELASRVRRRRLPRRRPAPSCATRSPQAFASQRFSIVEAITPPDDLSPISRQLHHVGGAAAQPTRRRPSIVSSQPTPRSRSSAV